jgi:hypothetical protein
LVNYTLDEIQENLLTSASTANEISARIDLLQASQFIVDSWRIVSAKTIQNCFVHCGFKHLDFEMPNKADSENDVFLEMYHIGNLGVIMNRQ